MRGGDAPTRQADLELALASARAAGQAVMAWFRTDAEVRHKSPDQPVTDADLRADAILRDRILGARPDDGWLSEETEDDPARLDRRRVWIIDPIDGTRSFIAGYREFAISVGLVEDGRAALGVVYNPATEDVLWATRGGGARRVRRWDGDPAPAPDAVSRLRVPAPGPGERPAIVASRSELKRGEFDAFGSEWIIRPLGSTAYKLAAVAAGVGHGFLSRGPKSEWDVVAGALIVEEAGGVVTDLRGDPLVYNRPDPRVHGILACAPSLHATLLRRARREPAPRLEGEGRESRESRESRDGPAGDAGPGSDLRDQETTTCGT